MNVASAKRGLCFLFLAVLWAGCVPMHSYSPERGDIFGPLHRGDLSAFEHKLSIDRHAGRDDAWTDLGQAFLDLAICREIAPPSERVRAEPEAHLLYELVILEDQRRLRLIAGSTADARQSWHAGTVHTRFTSRTFFNREAAEVDEDLIRWPESGDVWQDEWPAPTEIAYECTELGQREVAEEHQPPWEKISPRGPAGRLVAEWLQTEAALTAAQAVESDRESRKRAHRSLLFHRADLALAMQRRDDLAELAPEAVLAATHRALDDLLEYSGGDDSTPDFGRALRLAELAMVIDDPHVAVEALSTLMDHRDDAVASAARYLLVRLAWMQGWWDTAADASPELLDRDSPLHSAHAYFAATAHRHAGREDAFLAMGRQALRDRTRRADPFMGALYRDVLRQLARYDVDERTEEILEELGPRHRIAERQRELAEVALDMGRPEVAEDLIIPLLDSTTNARLLPRLHATLALAAFLRDDRSTFEQHIQPLSQRPRALREVIPQSRRSSFFAHQDAELARVLRAMLPLMAEWGDEPQARALRQVWLAAIVDHTQQFLRWAPESSVSTSLTELYHLAGQLLDAHPRGYAERVGSDGPSASALVLGTVELTSAPPIDEAPQPRLRWPAISSLLLIPVGPLPPTRLVSDIGQNREVSP